MEEEVLTFMMRLAGGSMQLLGQAMEYNSEVVGNVVEELTGNELLGSVAKFGTDGLGKMIGHGGDHLMSR